MVKGKVHIWVIGRSDIYKMYCGKKFPKEAKDKYVSGFNFDKATCKTCIKCFKIWELDKAL